MGYKHKCKYCGKDFENGQKYSKFCSVNCYSKYRMKGRNLNFKCNYCGKEFVSYLKTAKFCSSVCSYSARSKKNDTNRMVKCLNCGKEFFTYRKFSRKYCSRECYVEYGSDKGFFGMRFRDLRIPLGNLANKLRYMGFARSEISEIAGISMDTLNRCLTEANIKEVEKRT